MSVSLSRGSERHLLHSVFRDLCTGLSPGSSPRFLLPCPQHRRALGSPRSVAPQWPSGLFLPPLCALWLVVEVPV